MQTWDDDLWKCAAPWEVPYKVMQHYDVSAIKKIMYVIGMFQIPNRFNDSYVGVAVISASVFFSLKRLL